MGSEVTGMNSITIAILMFTALLLGAFLFRRRKPGRLRPVTGTITFSGQTQGDDMSKLVIRVDQTGAQASLAFKDAKGNVAQPAAPPVWSVTAPGIIGLAVADDGMSAQITPQAAGAVQIDVTAEGDPTPGVDTLHLSGDVQVTPAEIATGEIDFGPAT